VQITSPPRNRFSVKWQEFSLAALPSPREIALAIGERVMYRFTSAINLTAEV